MNSASEEVLFRKHYEHNLNVTAWKGVSIDQPVTLDYFMKDYTEHLEHHLNQLFNL
jgi:flagellar biosynthesis chaperone FliJ